MQKYNIALIPLNIGEAIIDCAKLLSNVADRYMLGEHSLPHVTLYQFYFNEAGIDQIWKRLLGKLGQKSIFLTFKEFSCLSFDNETHWVSLLPDNRDILMSMHAEVAGLLSEPVKLQYDPHMTLISSKDHDYEKSVKKLAQQYVPIGDNFILTLGKCDEIGQLTEIIFYASSIEG